MTVATQLLQAVISEQQQSLAAGAGAKVSVRQRRLAMLMWQILNTSAPLANAWEGPGSGIVGGDRVTKIRGALQAVFGVS